MSGRCPFFVRSVIGKWKMLVQSSVNMNLPPSSGVPVFLLFLHRVLRGSGKSEHLRFWLRRWIYILRFLCVRTCPVLIAGNGLFGIQIVCAENMMVHYLQLYVILYVALFLLSDWSMFFYWQWIVVIVNSLCVSPLQVWRVWIFHAYPVTVCGLWCVLCM